MNAIENIFKAYDVRGRVGSELNADVAERIGKALADWLPEKGAIAVGRDMRPDSGELAEVLIAGLQAQGRDVVDIGQVTSDMIYFAVGSLKLAGGAMVTASHNPGEYNGIKLCREDAKPIGQESGLFEIRDAVASKNFKPAPQQAGKRDTRDITEDWIAHVLSFVNPAELKEQRIAVDAGNGMAGAVFPELEPYVPWEVTELYFELDGTFPNHEANPLKFETLADLIKVIKDDELDGGIAFDGDGDRAFLVDETGTVLPGNVMNAMLAEYFLSKHGDAAILYDLRSSRAVPELIAQKGGKPVRTRVGHSFIKQTMREHDAPFGGEISGHFYFRDNYYADSGLIAAVIGLYVAGLSGKSLSELREYYTKYPSIAETNFEVTNKDMVLKHLRDTFKDKDQDELDGLTVDLGNGAWFNVRASNTEPLLRLNAEARSQGELDNLVSQVRGIITGENA